MRHRYWRRSKINEQAYALWQRDLRRLKIQSRILGSRVVASGEMVLQSVECCKEETWALWLAAWRMGGEVVLCMEGGVDSRHDGRAKPVRAPEEDSRWDSLTAVHLEEDSRWDSLTAVHLEEDSLSGRAQPVHLEEDSFQDGRAKPARAPEEDSLSGRAQPVHLEEDSRWDGPGDPARTPRVDSFQDGRAKPARAPRVDLIGMFKELKERCDIPWEILGRSIEGVGKNRLQIEEISQRLNKK